MNTNAKPFGSKITLVEEIKSSPALNDLVESLSLVGVGITSLFINKSWSKLFSKAT